MPLIVQPLSSPSTKAGERTVIMAPIKLIIFDFDGTLFNTHASIHSTIKSTFTTLLPGYTPTGTEIQASISSGAGISDTFRSLHPNPAAFTPAVEETWVYTYRQIYAEHGQSLISPFPGAETLLTEIQRRGIPMAIVSNKSVAAVATTLANNNLAGYFSEDLIIGDKTPGAKRKPDGASFVDVLVPRLSAMGVSVGPRDVLVVGDTAADIDFARNIGGRVCWCRYGYGDQEVCEVRRPDWVVDGLGEVVGVLDQV
ncbi:HAD-like domain-containing protein [Aspergillus californicus]